MNDIIKILPNYKKFSSYIEDVKKGTTPIMLSGLTDSGKIHFAYSTLFYSEKPICIITYNELQAKKIIKDLEYFSKDVDYFPKREIVTYDYIAESKDNLYKRINTLNNIYNKKAKIVVTTIEAIMQKIINKEVLYKNRLFFKVGETVNLEQIKEKLIELGYERCEMADTKCSFSIRGGIVDIAISEKQGVRIELWGDEIDSIRYFDTMSQRSTDKIEEAQIEPAHEFILEKSLSEITAKLIKKYEENEDIAQIKEGNYLSKIDKFFNSFYEEKQTILDYLNEDYIIFLDEINKIKSRSENVLKDTQNLIKSVVEKNKKVPDSFKILGNYLEFLETIKTKQTIYLEKQDIGFVDKQSMHAKRNGYSFSYREVNFFRSSMDLLFKEIQEAAGNKTVVILCGSKENTKKVQKLLIEQVPIVTKYINENIINKNTIMISEGELSTGFESYDFNLLVISVSEIFSTPQKRKKLSSEFKQGETIIFSELKPGDYIVHKTNGIGEFVGVSTIKTGDVTKDYIKLKYKGEDVLYIPTNSLDNIRKYIGTGARAPKVNKLGSKEWAQTKAKVKQNLQEVAKELIELYAKREHARGYMFSDDTQWQKEFEDSFEYVETDDQLRSISEVKKDMESEKPMDRLLCGDVGYGKTEVAIRAAFKACMDQKQVAYLVPTTVLANQQYKAFKERMKDYPIKVEVLNRFVSKKKQDETAKKLKLGEVDVVVGTHRLLSKDIEFKDLGLLIIDEEHRFGVKDKEKIKQLKNNIDVLTMTATPIPRTLHMSIVGIRDMSCLYEPPQNRRPVQTYVLEYDDEVIKEAITKELERDGQVFYLFNNVDGIELKAKKVESLVPEAKVAFAHGKMTGKEIEEIMLDFVAGNTNVLVCTTILESGIDIPNANTIIVENADRLGLAQLYQIRGRVGRANKQAYAYITYKRDKIINEVADKRLKAIKEFTELGSGFKIAMRDLEIRGAGSLLGEMQHGHMDQVGYDTYCKLLDEVVKEAKGIKVEEEQDVTIDLNVSSYIPDSYISNSTQKIEVYQNIALCRTEEDIKNVTEDILDRFGKMPKEMFSLIGIARIKEKCKNMGITKVSQKENKIVFYFNPESFTLNIPDLIEQYSNRIKFSTGINPYITFTLKNVNTTIQEIEEFLN